MTIHELLRDFELATSQRELMIVAYDESPDGFERVAIKARGMKNPPAALTTMIRSGQHKQTTTTNGKIARTTLEDIIAIGLRSYRARINKYPGHQEDAIWYAAWVASTWNSHYLPEDLVPHLRKRVPPILRSAE